MNTPNKEKNYVWSNLNMAEVIPGVNLPLVTSSLIEIFSPAARDMFNLPSRIPVIREIKGRLYLNLTVFEQSLKKIVRTDNFSVTDFFGGRQSKETILSNVSLAGKIGIFVFGIKTILNSFYLQHKFQRAITEVKKKTELFKKKVAGAEELSELIRLEKEIFSYLAELLSIGFKGLLYPFTSYFLFTSLCQKWLKGESNEKAHILLASGGRGIQCVEAFISIWNISRQIKGNSLLAKEFIASKSVSQAEELLLRSPKIYDKYQEFLKEHGYRCAKEIDISLPRWQEDRTFIISIIKNYLKSPEENNPKIRQRIIKKQQSLLLKKISEELPWWKLVILKKFLYLSLKAQVERENAKSEFIRILVPLRSLIFKTGTHLYEQGLLKDSSDVFMLTRKEIDNFYFSKADIDKEMFLTAIEKRKKEYKTYRQIKLPDVITDLEKLSGIRSSPLNKGISVLKGIAVSHGKIEGIARVINSVEEIFKLKPGDILVADHTDPGWTPVFATIKGVITNTGGLLSHASIVAREYSLPAVVNVANATSIIKDGENILLDGDKGIIKIIK